MISRALQRRGPASHAHCHDAVPLLRRAYDGGEEGLASIQCDLAVTRLFIGVELFRNGTQVTYNSKNNYSNSFINVDTEYPVSAGSYYTGADGTQYSNGTSSSVPYATSPTVYLQ